MACGIYFLNEELNLGPLLWERRVSATGPPEKSEALKFFFFFKKKEKPG